MNPETMQLLRGIFYRPRMHLEEIATVRDLLFFAQGVCCGLHPPYGGRGLNGFIDFLSQRLIANVEVSPKMGKIPTTFADISFLEMGEAVGKAFDEWVQTIDGN